MSGHISGPWELSNGAVWAISPWNARVCIANLTNFAPMNGIDMDANGRLIVAAPRLLAALKGLVDRCSRELADPEDVHEMHAAAEAIRLATETPNANR